MNNDMDNRDNDGDSIPDFIQLKQVPVNYIQQVDTDLLDPVVFNQGGETSDGFSRFTLQNKGFLSSHSKIFLSLQPSATNTDVYFAPHLGVGQLVKKAVLKIGNITLNEVDSWAGLYAIKSSLITNENNIERELFTTGRYLNHKFVYNDESSTNASSIGLDTHVEFDEQAGKIFLPDTCIMDGTSTTKQEECPSYQIDLSDLFPFLKVNQLPLYMIDQPINIELTFQPTTQFRAQIADTDTPGIPNNIVQSELKFCADYIFYGASNEMERYANANKDMSFSFVDYRLVEHTTSATELASGVIRNLGMANRLVSKVFTTLAYDANTYNEETILGQYVSLSPSLNASGVQTGALKYNVRYNDRFEYTTDIDNTARLFSQFTDAESIPFVTRSEYSNQARSGKLTDVQDFEGREQAGNLDGHFFYLGTRLTNGRVGQRGIELHISGDFPSVGRTPTLLRSYCEYLRVARLTNGMIEVYNA
tara:strand:+ start:2916 stop:4346 length:1431 start_codon:yes stop_codon:yes gene_type:complete